MRCPAPSRDHQPQREHLAHEDLALLDFDGELRCERFLRIAHRSDGELHGIGPERFPFVFDRCDQRVGPGFHPGDGEAESIDPLDFGARLEDLLARSDEGGADSAGVALLDFDRRLGGRLDPGDADDDVARLVDRDRRVGQLRAHLQFCA